MTKKKLTSCCRDLAQVIAMRCGVALVSLADNLVGKRLHVKQTAHVTESNFGIGLNACEQISTFMVLFDSLPLCVLAVATL